MTRSVPNPCSRTSGPSRRSRARGGTGPQAALPRAVWRTGLWSAGVAVLSCVTYLLFGRFVVFSGLGLPAVRAEAHLPWLVALPLVSLGSFWLDGVYIGATWAEPMFRAMALSTFVVFLPAWLTRGLGNDGLWLAFMLFLAARGVTMCVALGPLARRLAPSKRAPRAAWPSIGPERKINPQAKRTC